MTYDITHGSIVGVPFNIARKGVPITDPTGVACALVPGGADWETGTLTDAVVIDGDLCHQLTGTEPVGPYDLYIHVVANSETPIEPPGGLRINIV